MEMVSIMIKKYRIWTIVTSLILILVLIIGILMFTLDDNNFKIKTLIKKLIKLLIRKKIILKIKLKMMKRQKTN